MTGNNDGQLWPAASHDGQQDGQLWASNMTIDDDGQQWREAMTRSYDRQPWRAAMTGSYDGMLWKAFIRLFVLSQCVNITERLFIIDSSFYIFVFIVSSLSSSAMIIMEANTDCAGRPDDRRHSSNRHFRLHLPQTCHLCSTIYSLSKFVCSPLWLNVFHQWCWGQIDRTSNWFNWWI